MAEVLRLREAARLIGVSPGRLYRAIADGRLTAAPGGGPGKPTLVSLETLQTFCQSEGLRFPHAAEAMERAERLERAERSERPERSISGYQDIETLAGQHFAQVMARQSDYFERFLQEELTHLVARIAERVVDQVVERLAERFTASPPKQAGRSARSERAERSKPAIATPKAMVLTRLRAMQAEGLSLQAIANKLNAEGVLTLSGRGQWKKGTIANLLAEAED